MALCRSRKPAPLTFATLSLPIMMLLATGGHLTYTGIRVQTKLAADGRDVQCVVDSLETPEHEGAFLPVVLVKFSATPTTSHNAYFYPAKDQLKFATTEQALAHMGAAQMKDVNGNVIPGQFTYSKFQPGIAPPQGFGCYAYHGQDGTSVEKVVLTRTRAPVKNDETMFIISASVCGLTIIYLIWLCSNHAWRTALGREIGKVRVMAVGMNYTDCRTDGIGQLTGITDSNNFVQMCEEAGIDDITYLTDANYIINAMQHTAPTKDVVIATMADIGSRCHGDDMFIFFYAGHGDNVEDLDGDEDDGKDEAFVLMDAFGNGNEDTYLVDDEFSDALVDYFPPGCRILIVTDCCHSGTIADLDNERKYGDRPVVHIAGTQDHQEAADTGMGGAATTAMIETVRQLELGKGAGKYTVQQVFQNMQKWLITRGYTAASRVDPDLQNITLNWTAAADPGKMPWPITQKGFIIDAEHTNIDGMAKPLV
jgi:hypothetical protein